VSARVALLFPGQGSQRVGMLVDLACVEGGERLLDAAEALSGLPLHDIAEAGAPEQLANTRAAQPLLYLADWSAGIRAIAAGVTPAAVAGHSLGELAALAVAGVFSAEAGLELVVERSRLMAEVAAQTPGGMLAVLGLETPLIRIALEGIDDVWVANDNSEGQTVVSGTPRALDAAAVALGAAGARRLVPLAVAGPFHSPLMAPAADRFADVLKGAVFTDAAIPVFQNTAAAPATDAETIRQRLASQMVSPVRWRETMESLKSSGVTVLLECGPGAVLTGLAKRVEGMQTYAVEDAGIDKVVEEVSKR
jgi:[acyl-carrier-protein] S-malonyltransferase